MIYFFSFALLSKRTENDFPLLKLEKMIGQKGAHILKERLICVKKFFTLEDKNQLRKFLVRFLNTYKFLLIHLIDTCQNQETSVVSQFRRIIIII